MSRQPRNKAAQDALKTDFTIEDYKQELKKKENYISLLKRDKEQLTKVNSQLRNVLFGLTAAVVFAAAACMILAGSLVDRI